ncbi:MAG TPA: glycine dehydrogenase, partial [Verrucomicrobiae bacterium]|nr:glycine dehydrogenase [Verrucomicrobiae bacterium]
MSRADYAPNTPGEEREMLQAIGVSSVEELFAPIPAQLRAKSFDLPAGMSEMELLRSMRELAAKDLRPLPFVGGGFYDHYIPATVDHLA